MTEYTLRIEERELEQRKKMLRYCESRSLEWAKLVMQQTTHVENIREQLRREAGKEVRA